MNLDLNLDLKTGVPLGEVLRASLLRHEKSISDDPAFKFNCVQPPLDKTDCLTPSYMHVRGKVFLQCTIKGGTLGHLHTK